MPSVGVDDAVDDGETEAGAAGTRGEEGIAGARADLRVHALAGVDDVDREPVDAVVGGGVDAHGERPGRAHGLHAVVDEVVEHLAKQVRVAPHAPPVALDFDLDFARLALGVDQAQGPLDTGRSASRAQNCWRCTLTGRA